MFEPLSKPAVQSLCVRLVETVRPSRSLTVLRYSGALSTRTCGADIVTTTGVTVASPPPVPLITMGAFTPEAMSPVHAARAATAMRGFQRTEQTSKKGSRDGG